MTRHERSINVLMIMLGESGDPRQRQALEDAIKIMRDASAYFDRAYLQGLKDGIRKGQSQ